MRITKAAERINGRVHPQHTVEVVCSNCEYDLLETELHVQKCPNCRENLVPKQNMSIVVTTLPPAAGKATKK